MNILKSIIHCFIILYCAISFASETYLQRFHQYWEWNEHFPPIVTPAFLNFIQESKPLSNKLRNRYLHLLAYQKNWAQFITLYQSSSDTTLQCLQLSAQLHLNQTDNFLTRAKQLWLTGQSLPNSCDDLIHWLSKTQASYNDLLRQRLLLAFNNNNLNLSRYLIKQLPSTGLAEADLLTKISQNPRIIAKLSPSSLHAQFYLFGLKCLISKNMPLAIEYYHSAKAQSLLSESQKQSFLVMLVTYQAIRNDKATLIWFNKIKSQNYTLELIEWQIRYALRHHQWQNVLNLSQLKLVSKEPTWIYWHARAMNMLGNTTQAKLLYESLAKTRSYYGFLASRQLKTPFHFQDELAAPNAHLLSAYLPILNQIKFAYNNQQKPDASRMISDFSLELSPAEHRALIYWVMFSLHWPAKAILMANTPELINMLSLRFPLTHQPLITIHAQNYHIPPELIFAVIRQESGFRDEVISSAGAHGLMQLMPSTAKKVAQSKKIMYHQARELFASHKNIQLGTAYLQMLAQVFKAHPVLMAAAYNAGPRQVKLWLRENASQPVDIWIETIPWRETRNYIKNIVAFYLVYQYRMKQTSDIKPLMKMMY